MSELFRLPDAARFSFIGAPAEPLCQIKESQSIKNISHNLNDVNMELKNIDIELKYPCLGRSLQ